MGLMFAVGHEVLTANIHEYLNNYKSINNQLTQWRGGVKMGCWRCGGDVEVV